MLTATRSNLFFMSNDPLMTGAKDTIHHHSDSMRGHGEVLPPLKASTKGSMTRLNQDSIGHSLPHLGSVQVQQLYDEDGTANKGKSEKRPLPTVSNNINNNSGSVTNNNNNNTSNHRDTSSADRQSSMSNDSSRSKGQPLTPERAMQLYMQCFSLHKL
uniref:Uncharacterized protein n=1 Tax=Clytia hemisphaerica TaxID=252671 RepID=A0A7M5UBZ5_9CNID